MYVDPQYGPVIPEKAWAPSPRYLLRRDRVNNYMKKQPPGTLLEIGCGAGALLYEYSLRGFTCTALELSADAREMARSLNGSRVAIHEVGQSDWNHAFDCLFAFEVLEHIEEDRQALSLWRSWLKPDGLIGISVPSHMRKWTASDTWAGHYRRYERDDLIHLFTSSGFRVERLESYGFPLANLVNPFRTLIHVKSLSRREKQNTNERSINNELSGIERRTETKYFPILCSAPGRLFMKLAFALQSWSVNTDWGNGYLLFARKTV